MRKFIISTAIILILVLAAGLGMLYVIGDRLLEEAIKAELAALEDELSLAVEKELEDALNNIDSEVLEAEDHNNAGKESSLKAEGNTLNGNDGKSGNANENVPQGNASAGNTAQSTDGGKDKVNNSGEKSQEGDSGGGNPGEKNNSQGSGNQQTHVSSDKENEIKEDKATSSENNPQETSTGKDAKVFTPEKILQVKDQVSPMDKIEASALALKRLSLSDVNELISMISGGVTQTEKERAKQIAYSKFSEEEIKKIKEMYAKYMR